MLKFAAAEAQRLGLELALHNSAGYSTCGGPWNKPENSMKEVVTSEKLTQGPLHFNEVLPQPLTKLDSYRDIAVVAFRTPKGELATPMAALSPQVTASVPLKHPEELIDGSGTRIDLPQPTPNSPQFLQLEFAQPFTARMLTLTAGQQPTQACSGRLDISDDGRTFKLVRPIGWGRIYNEYRIRQVFNFAPVTARFYRIVFTQAILPMSFTQVNLSQRFSLEMMPTKLFYGPREPFGSAVADMWTQYGFGHVPIGASDVRCGFGGGNPSSVGRGDASPRSRGGLDR